MNLSVETVRTKNHHERSFFNQLGKSKFFLILLVFLIADPLVVGGLSLAINKKTKATIPSQKTSMSTKNQITNVSTPTIQPKLNPNCKYNDPQLCKYLTNGKNYENVSSITVGKEGGYGRNPSEIISEYENKETYHIVIKDNGKETSNYINIGNTSYDYDYYKKLWWKHTLTVEEEQSKEQFSQRLQTFALEHRNDPHQTLEYKFITKEACNDKMCFKYESYYLDQPEVKAYIWFDDQQYLKIKELFEDPGAGTIETTYSYGNVHISIPSPVKESTK